MTIYALGFAYLQMDFAKGIPAGFLFGVAHCFEYAAYENQISMLLLNFAVEKARKAVEKQRSKLFQDEPGLPGMSMRAAPEVTTRPTRVGGVERCVEELTLFLPQGITHVVMCVDDGEDRKVLEDVMDRMKPLPTGGTLAKSSRASSRYIKLEFEYHGTLYFDWAVCVIAPRSFKQKEFTREQIGHILSCMQIAQSFQGACQACDKLVSKEIRSETAAYLKGNVVGRDPKDMNRLRTLALTIVNLSDFRLVTEAQEDLKFYECFDKHAFLADRRENIRKQCGELFGTVLEAKRLAQEERLNMIIVSLTSLTALSVFVDAQGFLSASGPLLPALGERWLVFGLAVAAVACIAAVVVRFIFGEGKGSSRSGGKAGARPFIAHGLMQRIIRLRQRPSEH